MAWCSSVVCGKDTDSKLKCPICLKNNVESVFCDQTCFKTSWSHHKYTHPQDDDNNYDPFPNFKYTGLLRPLYPLAPTPKIPKHIKLTDYARAGKPLSEIKNDRYGKIPIMSDKDIAKLRKVCKLSREILDAVAENVRIGITTNELDQILHRECMKRNCYPSPLNYYNFPKSFCTSVNEVVCHGIPDQRPLEDGDIVNLDVSIYYLGFHSDLNETYYVGDKAKTNPDTVRLVETTREALELAIKAVKPGLPFREIGNIIEDHAHKNGVSVVRTFCGHGTNQLFHCQPYIPHYAKNKAIGIAKPGMVFTIEPMLNLGTYKDTMWPDNWTAATEDGKYSAQFEHMMVVTEDGCEVLTARTDKSPGGAIARPGG